MSDNPTTVNLLQVKAWFIPADAESYAILKKAGLPLLKFHGEMLPTIKLATDSRGIVLRAKKFGAYLDSKFEALGSAWLKNREHGRKCLITEKRLVFSGDLNTTNKKGICKIDHYLSDLFARWGYAYTSTYSETNAKLKLVADFYFDPKREPVVPMIDPVNNPEAEILLGFSKIKLTFFTKATDKTKARGWKTPIVLLEVFTQTGVEWTAVWSSTFSTTQIGDMNSIIAGISLLHTAAKGNT